MALGPQHTCPDDQQIALHAICDDGSVGASDIFILIAVILVLVAIGFVVYNWVKRRFSE